MKIVGILNLTRDSFSDGGVYLDREAACAHADRLLDDGADIIDVGAESSHPDSENVTAEMEIERLTPVLERLIADGVEVSVDTNKPEVIRRVLSIGVRTINDITALTQAGSVEALRDSPARVVIMHSMSATARAARIPDSGKRMIDRIIAFFHDRIAALRRAGIGRERLILDPGMGFFLSSDPEPSLEVLRGLADLRTLGLPLYVSTSRKSFIGRVLDRPLRQRAAGTLATELWAWRQGVDYIRTHDVRSLADAVRMTTAIAGHG